MTSLLPGKIYIVLVSPGNNLLQAPSQPPVWLSSVNWLGLIGWRSLRMYGHATSL